MAPVAVSKVTFVRASLLKRVFESISVVPSCAMGNSLLYSVFIVVYILNSALPGTL